MKYFCIVTLERSELDDGDLAEITQGGIGDWWEGNLKDSEAFYIEAKSPYDAAREAHANTGRTAIVAVFATPPTIIYAHPSESFSYRVVSEHKPRTKSKGKKRPIGRAISS